AGGIPVFQNCALGASTNFWNQTSGTLFPINSTVDLLVGATSTSSSKFAFINVNSGTPTASISANSGNNATYLTGTGVLGTTNKQNLTIGDINTGNVTIAALNGGTGSVITLNALTESNAATTISLTGASPVISTTSNNNLTISAGTGTLNLNTSNNGPVTIGTGLLTVGGSIQMNGTNFFQPVSGGISGFWQLGSNVIAPSNTINDLVIGGNSTQSAKFQIFGATGNATTSGTLTFGNVAGVIQTTNFKNLTLGGSTTGNIIINPLNGVAGGNITPAVNNVTDLGLSGLNFRNIFATTYNSGSNVGQTITNGTCFTSTGGIITGAGSCPNQTNWWTESLGALS
ncbi:MAG: hypothetical protein KGL95_08425, partial [Patescibacteria group bacterium]|nr:hypothetical protein [Patescibacteria group bacterium]